MLCRYLKSSLGSPQVSESACTPPDWAYGRVELLKAFKFGADVFINSEFIQVKDTMNGFPIEYLYVKFRTDSHGFKILTNDENMEKSKQSPILYFFKFNIYFYLVLCEM